MTDIGDEVGAHLLGVADRRQIMESDHRAGGPGGPGGNADDMQFEGPGDRHT